MRHLCITRKHSVSRGQKTAATKPNLEPKRFEPKRLEPTWLGPIWLEPTWLEPKWLRSVQFVLLGRAHINMFCFNNTSSRDG